MFDHKYKMKAKTIVLVLSGLVAGCLAVSAQNNSPAAATATTEAAAPAVETAATTETVAPATAAPAIVVAQDTPVAAPASTESAPAPADTAAKVPAPAPSGPPVIPLIVMDDVPLTDAIKNLARQASLNYMLDPKISFGQMGPDGKPAPQPSVSIRWENITAAQALNALLNNYSLQLVEDPKNKIARVTTQDPAAPPVLITKIIKLNYANPSNMVSTVQSTFTDKRSKATPDVRSSQLVVTCTEKEMVEVNGLIEHLDSPTKQVLIQARIMETSLNPKSVKGVDWTGTLQHQNLAVGNNLQANSPSDSVNNTLAQKFPKMLFDTASGFNPATAFLDADGVNVALSFLNTENHANTIATPHAVTVDNEMAVLEVIDQVPVVNVTAGTANTTGGSSVSYTNVGIKLRVTPHVSANNSVLLKVVPEVSSHVSDLKFSVGAGSSISVPTFASRTIDTTVSIPSGHTLVLGGLVSDELTKDVIKVPFLGDIPGLGYAFRHSTDTRHKKNLIIFITPTIVQDSDFQVDKDDFLKTPVSTATEPAWNEKKPYDWSAPVAKNK